MKAGLTTTCLLTAGLLLTCCSPVPERQVYRSATERVAERTLALARSYEVVGLKLRREFPSICNEDSWVLLYSHEGEKLRYWFDYHNMSQAADALRVGSQVNVRFNEAGDIIEVHFPNPKP